MELVVVEDLPAEAVAAAGAFYGAHVQRVLVAARGLRGAADPAVLMVFAAAGHDHREWRLAAVQSLAREAAPVRVNAVAGGDAASLAAARAWLAAAPGITGQVFALDSHTPGSDID